MKIAMDDVRCGDVLFVRNKQNIKLLSHIALVIEVDKIFHCCPQFGTAVVQSQQEFFSLYEQALNFQKMVRYIDPRNRALRDEHKEVFIGD